MNIYIRHDSYYQPIYHDTNALVIPLHSNGGHGEDRGDNAEVCHEATETAEENSKDPIPLKKIITMIPSGGKHRWKKVAS